MLKVIQVILALLLAASTVAGAAETAPANPAFDPALAKQTGANEQGMRKYVLVILKTGPNKVTGPARDEMFKGHFANMKRLAAEGVLAHAGPLDGVDGWRGLFVLAVDGIDAAKQHVATDPVIVQGEMVAEYHVHYGSAALMLLNGLYPKVAKQPM